jgi:hypothetical protein
MMLSQIKRLPMYQWVKKVVYQRGEALIAARVFNHDSAARILALAQGAEYAAAHMKGALKTGDKDVVRAKALQEVSLRDGLNLEFGVWSGKTINKFADTLGPSRTIHGFDSFEGLPEDWFGEFGKGRFHTQGNLPEVRPNVILHKGWFDETLPDFVAENPGPVAFLHVDCDLYSSTKTIFQYVGDRIVPGTVIVFDEYFNYPGWREHEHKAFQELVQERNLKYRWLAYNSVEWNAALVITG